MGDDRGGRGDWVEKREGPSPKIIVAAIAVILLVIFALQNSDEAGIDFLFLNGRYPLWLVIAVSAVLGFVIGWAVGRAGGRRRAIEKLTD